ncbi:MAG: hypothetical protein ACOCYV_02610 [Planctomycetota bacterium]
MGFLGPLASVHHPATSDSFADQLRDLLTSWPVAGIVWDELKALDTVDHSPAARRALGPAWSDDPAVHLAAQVAFFGRMNAWAKELKPVCRTSLFVHAHYTDPTLLASLAAMPGLDEFGCDGRPWAVADGGSNDSADGPPSKLLIDAGPRFIAAARAAGSVPLALIENHALRASDLPLMERRLPAVRAQGWGHLLYYYFPRSCENPDASMRILGEALARPTPG